MTLHQIQVDNLVGAMTDDNYETATNYDLSGAELIREWQIDASGVPQNTRRFNLLDVGATGTTESGALRSCDGAMPSRVAPGDIATVITDPDPLRARSEPPSGEIVELLYNGYQLTIADGPRCIDGIPWFQVELRDGTLVWIAESVDDEYFIELRAAAQRTPVQVTGEDGALAPGAYFLQASSPDPDAYSQSSQRHVMLVSSAKRDREVHGERGAGVGDERGHGRTAGRRAGVVLWRFFVVVGDGDH